MSRSNIRPVKIHEGRNLKRFRDMLGIKQETLAFQLGEDWSQKRISLLETKEKLEDHVLTEIAKFLKMPEEAIRNFDEKTALHNIRHNYEQFAVKKEPFKDDFNSMAKLVEKMDAMALLYTENKALYERLLQKEKEKTTLIRIVSLTLKWSIK